METEEVWKAIPSLNGLYEASSHGRIRSLDRETSFVCRYGCTITRLHKGRVLSSAMTGQVTKGGKSGYHSVATHINGNRRMVVVHVLVAEAFIGPRQHGYEVNHIDGDKTNNHITNLEYVTRQENMDHAKATGLWNCAGEGNGRAKCTEAQVRLAHELRKNGASYGDISAATSMTRRQIKKVCLGHSWCHLGLEPLNSRKSRVAAQGAD